MKRILLLLLVAVVTFLLIALYKNPEILNDIWLWLVGLAGTIIKFGRDLVEYVASFFKGKDTEENKKPATNNSVTEDPFDDSSNQNVMPIVPPAAIADITIDLLRYSDDGQTTVGLLYIDKKFYCYTLEDTHHDVKVPGETRIPAGNYQLGLRKELTPLTEKYRTRYPEWFTYHLELQNVPKFNSIYIHSGGDHNDTEGCILVSDSLSISDTKTFLTNSRNTFKTLYKFLSTHLDNNKKILIKVQDENWASVLAS